MYKQKTEGKQGGEDKKKQLMVLFKSKLSPQGGFFLSSERRNCAGFLKEKEEKEKKVRLFKVVFYKEGIVFNMEDFIIIYCDFWRIRFHKFLN